MPAKRMSAPVASRVYVSGSRSATVIAGPMPGSTPTAVPMNTPNSAYIRYWGCSAVAKPSSSALRLSIEDRYPVQERAGGQREPEPDAEDDLCDESEPEADQQRHPPALGAERDGRTTEQHGGGERPAGQFDQDEQGEEAEHEQQDGAPVGLRARIDVLALLGLAAVPPGDVDDHGDRGDEQDRADEVREEPRAEYARRPGRHPDEPGADDGVEAEGRTHRGEGVLADDPAPARGGSGGRARPIGGPLRRRSAGGGLLTVGH